jgi:hypothetical protein
MRSNNVSTPGYGNATACSGMVKRRTRLNTGPTDPAYPYRQYQVPGASVTRGTWTVMSSSSTVVVASGPKSSLDEYCTMYRSTPRAGSHTKAGGLVATVDPSSGRYETSSSAGCRSNASAATDTGTCVNPNDQTIHTNTPT